jgi:hypothetical protein
MIERMSRTCLMNRPSRPQISASASPRFTASAAITVVLVRTMVRAVRRHAAPADQRVEQRDIVAIARIVLGVDHLEIAPGLDRQAEALQRALSITCGRPIRIGWAMPILDQHLGGAQHALVLAIGKATRLAWPGPGRSPASSRGRSGTRSG